MWLGIAAGLAGLEHGYFEILQGNTRPVGLVFPSMGPPCDPAMSVLPNLRATGLLVMLIGVAMIVWSAAFLHVRRGDEATFHSSVRIDLRKDRRNRSDFARLSFAHWG